MIRGKLRADVASIALALLILTIVGLFANVHAQSANQASDFSLQVTPSPLVATVKPGEVTKLELKIRNAGTTVEELKIEPRSFTFNSSDGQVALKDTTPPEISQWISFSTPNPKVLPGQWVTEQVTISLPKDSGFSYSFAIVVSRKNAPIPVEGSRLIKGSLAIFSLINVDRPGATSKLQVTSLQTDKHVYEFLPAKITVRFKNTGNTIVQPYGNIFIQRGKNAKTPIATLPVNDNKSYILPATERTTSTSWASGFPVYQTATNDTGTTAKTLRLDWDHASNFRFGRYTAKLIAVYSDGERDIPIEGEVSFWVIPWRTILILLAVIAALWAFTRWRGKRRTDKAVKRALDALKRAEQEQKKAKKEAQDAKESRDT